MNDVCLKFRLLLWKNYMLQRRKVIVSLLQIGIPVFFAVLLIFIRQKVDAKDVTDGKNYKIFHIQSFPLALCPARPMCVPVFNYPKWKLYYTPNDEFLHEVMAHVQKKLHSWFQGTEVVPYESEDEMVAAIIKNFESIGYENGTATNHSDVLGGIVFNTFPKNISQLKSMGDIQYKIRLRYSWGGMTLNSLKDLFDQERGKWHTETMFPTFQANGPRDEKNTNGGPPDYYSDGFLTLQYAVDVSFIELLSNRSDVDQHEVVMQRFPYPPWRDDKFVMVLQQQFPFILLLSFIFTALHIVKDIVHEKERKLKETLKIIGLSNWLHWAAWFVKYLLFLLISVTLMTLIFCLSFSHNGSIIGYTAPTVLLAFLLAYSVATISFSFMISVFFSKANSAAAAAGVLFFVSYIPYIFIQPRYASMSWIAKVSSCLISNVAMALGGQIIGMFEGTGAGIQWSTINKGVSVDDDFTMLDVIVMLLVDSVLYGMITWYIEAVFPGEFGVPQRWYFPFQLSYWCGAGSCKGVVDETSPLISQYENTINGPRTEYFEADPVSMTPGIRIRNLKKVYDSSVTPAVKGTTMNMYEGQITALLGHNGAGKTTTISMLTGLIPPTEGDAIINGYNIRTEISSVRESLGLCPQHNVLFDTLTVQEHLEFFAQLKKVPKTELEMEVNKYMALFGLTAKANAASKTLSGGQKRKLSVAMALIGGSKIVILDEPSSGMDPNARRQTWDILNKHKQGRTVILTTHYMDEADVLGDRIAIMAEGVVKCCGTPLFLKKKYGAGYHLVMVKQQSCDVNKVTEVLKNHVDLVTVESNTGAELRYLLPYEGKSKFQDMFCDLESQKEHLGVDSFGLSVTTMEEVFLRVGDYGSDLEESSSQYMGLAPRPLSCPTVNSAEYVSESVIDGMYPTEIPKKKKVPTATLR